MTQPLSHHHHHHRHHAGRSTRRISLILLVAGLLLLAGGVADFVYFAYQSSECFVDNPDPVSGQSHPREAVVSDTCAQVIRIRDTHQRLDALVAMLGVVLLVGAGIHLSKAPRHVKRLALAVEVVVLVLAVVYGFLLAYALQ